MNIQSKLVYYISNDWQGWSFSTIYSKFIFLKIKIGWYCSIYKKNEYFIIWFATNLINEKRGKVMNLKFLKIQNLAG